MITNKDIRVENGSLIINGDPYPLDGQSPEAIMQIVEDNSDTTPTENSTNPVTSGGIFDAFKKVGLSVVADSEALTSNTPIDIDTGSSDGVYLVLVAQSAGLDLTELYVVKVTNYAGGTTVKPLLQTQTYASTVTATARSSEANGKITITSPVNCTCSVFKFRIF